MPIDLSIPIERISQDEFHAIDRMMLSHAFDIHNRFGRLLDESVYKAELANRCDLNGSAAQREVRIRVSHDSFVKDYFIDLLLGGSTIIEAKTVNAITDVHRTQGLNYLLLSEAHHGSLINFRSKRVQREFLSTQLTHERRRNFRTVIATWPTDDDHARLIDLTLEFCADVGLGLEVQLYRQAIPVLIGRSNRQLVPILSGPCIIGYHQMHLLRDDTGLVITSLPNSADYREHLRRLVLTTPLAGIAWINLKLGVIQFERIKGQAQR